MDFPTYSFRYPADEQNQNSIFKSLLTQIEIQITSTNPIFNIQDMLNPIEHYDIEKQMQCQVPNKSVSEWVWKDEYESSMQEISPIHDLPSENFRLKRVQSMRIQQENKLNMFIRSNNLINEEDEPGATPNINEAFGLSPRKKKRIQKERQPCILLSNNRKSKINLEKDSN